MKERKEDIAAFVGCEIPVSESPPVFSHACTHKQMPSQIFGEGGGRDSEGGRERTNLPDHML